MNVKTVYNKDILIIDEPAVMVENISSILRKHVTKTLRRYGGVVGISGGIDSSVTLALAVKALGADKVLGVLLPEKDSSNESKRLALLLANKYGVRTVEENITKALEGFGCYLRRDEAVSRVFPEYDPATYKMKIGVNTSGLNQNLPPVFSITIIDQNGNVKTKMLPAQDYLQIVAASNFKQRCRMSMLYYHAERMHYAVIGTPNKHEVEQGFFVKYGDGGADVMPIANLYKSQVYQLASYLGVPEEIIERTPTTDTYTAEQTQEEFFYQMPFKEMDLLWYAYEKGLGTAEVAQSLNKSENDIKLIFSNFNRKQKTTDYLRKSPILDF